MNDDADKTIINPKNNKEKKPVQEGEDQTIIKSVKNNDNDQTVIKDADETTMGDLPDMDLLSLGAKLEIISQKRKGEDLFISKIETVIGRSDDCDWTIDQPGVSRHHAKISYLDQELFVEDLGSKYGIIKKGQKIEGKTVLKPNDILQIGEVSIKVNFMSGGGSAQFDFKNYYESNKKLVLISGGVMGFLVLMIFLKLILGSGTQTTTVRTQKTQPKTTQFEDVYQKDIQRAKRLYLDNEKEEAIQIIDSVLDGDPSNSKALELKEKWTIDRQIQSKILQIKQLIQIKSFEQAKQLLRSIRLIDASHPELSKLERQIQTFENNQNLSSVKQEITNLIEQNQMSQASMKLKESKDLLSEEDFNDLSSQLKSKEQSASLFENARKDFEQGELKSALSKINQLKQEQSLDPSLIKFETKLKKIEQLLLKSKRLLNSGNDLSARPVLEEIMQLTSPANRLHQKTKKSYDQIQSKVILIAHQTYQDALKSLKEKDYQKAWVKIDQLSDDFKEITYYQSLKNLLKVRLDNLAVSLYQAAYVLEEKDPMKSKEIWQRLVRYLPSTHPYAQKAKAKIRF